jgi:hypothetical protein
MKNYLKRKTAWWKDNFKRKSTWIGFIGLFIGYNIYQDKAVFHKLLENIVDNEGLVTLIVGTISGYLIRRESANNKD